LIEWFVWETRLQSRLQLESTSLRIGVLFAALLLSIFNLGKGLRGSSSIACDLHRSFFSGSELNLFPGSFLLTTCQLLRLFEELSDTIKQQRSLQSGCRG
jgi:hypothetical protein